jgi:putative ABC transport system permease protein
MKQMADIGLIVTSIMGAVFFTLLLLSGNTMMQAVRERTSELAVMKTIGFSSQSVLAMVLAESVLLLVLGGVIGLLLAMLVVGGLQVAMGGAIPIAPVGGNIWTHAMVTMIVVGLLVGALPALRAMRLNIVDALAGR